MIDIYRLTIFLRVAETLSFSEAAEQLHLSQPTVSKHIRDLERELGLQLFDRSGVKPRLTEAGQAFLPWARKLIAQSNDLERIAQSLQGKVTGQLKIACTTAAGRYILPRLAARFRQRHPQVHLTILTCTQEEAIFRLLKEEADLGVVSVEAGGNDLECQPFFTDHIILIAPANHPWASRPAIEPAELLEAPLILREPTAGTRRALLSALAGHDISLDNLNVFLEVGSVEGIVTAVTAGVGVAFVSRLAANCALAWGDIVEVPVTGLDLRRSICMVRRSLSTPNRAQDAFWGFVSDPANADLLRLAEL